MENQLIEDALNIADDAIRAKVGQVFGEDLVVRQACRDLRQPDTLIKLVGFRQHWGGVVDHMAITVQEVELNGVSAIPKMLAAKAAICGTSLLNGLLEDAHWHMEMQGKWWVRWGLACERAIRWFVRLAPVQRLHWRWQQRKEHAVDKNVW